MRGRIKLMNKHYAFLGAPDLDPWRGCVEEDWREFVEEDCSQAFDDVGFHAWCFDQA